MNRVIKTALVAVACLSAAAVTGVAHAEPGLPGTVRYAGWVGMTDCGEGAITGHDLVDLPGGGRELRTTGWARSCPPPSPSGPFQILVAFGLILYNDSGAHVLGTTEHGPRGQLFVVDAAIALPADLANRPVRAVCLAGSLTHRLACVSVQPRADGPPPGSPVAVNDPMVSPEQVQATTGICGGCVGWPNDEEDDEDG